MAATRVRAGRVTTAVVLVALAVAILVAVGDDTAGGAILGCCTFVLCLALGLLPMAGMSRSMAVPLPFVTAVVAITVALGVFALSEPVSAGRGHRVAMARLLGLGTIDGAGVERWSTVAVIAVAGAVVALLVALAMLMRLRREPGWKAAPPGPVGFFAEGRRGRERR